MKRLLDRLVSRWYTPNERYADAVNCAQRIAAPEPPNPEYIELKPGCYWPVPETQTMMLRARCS